jgi:hypothetical protein
LRGGGRFAAFALSLCRNAGLVPYALWNRD